jgi:hypothetical protein
MKWIYLHIFILILVLSNFSQEQRRFNFGIKTGAVLSSFWGNGVDNFEESMSEGVRDFDGSYDAESDSCWIVSYDLFRDCFMVGELQYLRLGKIMGN